MMREDNKSTAKALCLKNIPHPDFTRLLIQKNPRNRYFPFHINKATALKMRSYPIHFMSKTDTKEYKTEIIH